MFQKVSLVVSTVLAISVFAPAANGLKMSTRPKVFARSIAGDVYGEEKEVPSGVIEMEMHESDSTSLKARVISSISGALKAARTQASKGGNQTDRQTGSRGVMLSFRTIDGFIKSINKSVLDRASMRSADTIGKPFLVKLQGHTLQYKDIDDLIEQVVTIRWQMNQLPGGKMFEYYTTKLDALWDILLLKKKRVMDKRAEQVELDDRSGRNMNDEDERPIIHVYERFVKGVGRVRSTYRYR